MGELKATIFNIQRYSIDDGPGIRTTVFFKGCPLGCLWCSNPESQDPRPEITYRYTSCKHCLTCVAVCPEKIITHDDDGIHIDRSRCTLCFKCTENCVPEALDVSGKEMTVDEVLKTVKRDADYYEASGGGVTASGGEILMQADFVAELFKRCRELGIGTCADTSGFGDTAQLDRILDYSDIVLYDLKQLDCVKHREYTGVGNELILTNLRRVIERKVPVIIRVPLIPGYNNDEENLRALSETVKTLSPEAPVNILPYHSYGSNKYRMVDKVYTLDDLNELTEEQKESARAFVESFGLKCEVSQ